MDVRNAYNIWAGQYDTNKNRTRDLEAVSLQQTLSDIQFDRCLEIGCGTGKNTQWLLTRARQVTAVDLSEEMLSRARQKIDASNVEFKQADITKDWSFAVGLYDMVTFSLVLEHIENLDPVFEKLSGVTDAGGYIYVGELHPFKQYGGTRARFETGEGTTIVNCFNHHISDFTGAAARNGFRIVQLSEYFDDNNRAGIPRILTLLFKKG
jgi:ubiquinone/menaquinone biosynthesis C-methylase UbiE